MNVVKFSHFVDPCKCIWNFTWFRCHLYFNFPLKVHFISFVTIIKCNMKLNWTGSSLWIFEFFLDNGKKLWWLHVNHLETTCQLIYNYFSTIIQLHVAIFLMIKCQLFLYNYFITLFQLFYNYFTTMTHVTQACTH
jgi:hypothetical protein